jgi:acetyl esterase/lipase
MNRAESLFSLIDTATLLYINPKHIKNVTCIKNIPYGNDPAQQVDIYYADAKSYNKPVIVNIHGGGFIRGDKNYRRYMCELFAAAGWFVINVNYRTCPRVQIVEEYEDCWSALSMIKRLKKDYGFDDSKIVLTGDSAGAHLAAHMEAALTNDNLRTGLHLPELDIKISGLLLFCGVYDFNALLNTEFMGSLLKVMAETLTGMKLNSVRDVRDYPYFDFLSTVNFVNPKWCPVCICYSAKDVLTHGQGEIMFEKLSQNGVPLFVHHTSKFFDNHCYHFSFASKASKEALAISFKFLDGIKNG